MLMPILEAGMRAAFQACLGAVLQLLHVKTFAMSEPTAAVSIVVSISTPGPI